MSPESTDYLVVGSGAMGLAFSDDLIAADRKAHLTIVDRRLKPGGHWNDAYPFVRLHQPAVAYGVNSEALGTGGADLSSRSELLAYFERAVRRLTDSGRVRFLSATEHIGEGRIRSLLTGEESEVEFDRKLVDATYMDVQVPATHPPRFEVDPDVDLVAPNALATLSRPHGAYVVAGSGKTGGDTVVHLLDRGVDPGRITWVMPKDMWLWNREVVQPKVLAGEMTSQLRAVAEAESVDQIFEQLEERESISRIDPAVTPSKWRCATFDRRERNQLRRIDNIVRAGRITGITGTEIKLEQGSLPIGNDALIVNCTANGLASRPPVPIFSERKITLQSIFECQQVFSAAAIGHLEGRGLDPERLNAEIKPVPHPETTADFAPAMVATANNSLRLGRIAPIWLSRARLCVFTHAPKRQALRALLQTRALLPMAEAAAERLARDG